MKRDTQIVGNTGMYWVCYQLSCLGWNCMPTSRNARGVDIIAYNIDCSDMVSIQVKSLSKRSPVPLGPSLDKVMGDYWVIVSNLQGGEPTTFVLEPEEIKALAHRGEKDGRVSYWLQPKEYEKERFQGAWERIGSPETVGQNKR
jgi:hypothetical protein